MTKLYTDYVSNLKTDGSPPSDEKVEQILTYLGKDLRREMNRRGLFEAPPAFLGVLGNSWHDPATFSELVVDSYTFIFINRLRGLQNQAMLGRDLGGLVRRNIRNFISERQRRNDPIGYRYFKLLRRSLTDTIAAGKLHVLAGDPEIRNDTVFGFDARTDPARLSPGLAALAVRLNDELLPDLIDARGGAVPQVVQQLSGLIIGLQAEGVEVFRFKDLIDNMKRDARQRWSAIWHGSIGELAVEGSGDEDRSQLVPVVRPFETIDRLGELHICVSSSIDGLADRQKTREYLWRLWMHLRGIALGEEEAPGNRARPSDVQLSRHLDIPRGRLRGLFTTLRALVEACRSGRIRPAERPVTLGRDQENRS